MPLPLLITVTLDISPCVSGTLRSNSQPPFVSTGMRSGKLRQPHNSDGALGTTPTATLHAILWGAFECRRPSGATAEESNYRQKEFKVHSNSVSYGRSIDSGAPVRPDSPPTAGHLRVCVRGALNIASERIAASSAITLRPRALIPIYDIRRRSALRRSKHKLT